MQRDSDRQGDEDAWRAIVENYGDRIELDDVDGADGPDDLEDVGTAPTETTYTVPLLPASPEGRRAGAGEGAEDEDRFVPPPPPPLPSVPGDRLAAWVGLFGSPAVLLLCLVVGFSLPPFIGYLLVAAFIGGFVYLVATMPRGPADPWDDGARL